MPEVTTGRGVGYEVGFGYVRTFDQRAYNDKDEAAIRKLIKQKPDATLAEVAAAIGKPACPGTVCRTLSRMKLPRKKSPRTLPSETVPTS